MPGTSRWLTFLAGMLVAALVEGCASSPTQPSNGAALIIRPAADGIVIGQNQVYHAWLADQGGEREVSATWTLSNVGVASVSTAGSVTALRLGTTTLTAAFGALSRDTSLAIVNDFGGHWLGTARITSCSRQSGEGPNTCGAEIGLVLPIDLMLNQDGRQIAGTATLHRILVTGSVTGYAQPSGAMNLSGELRTNGGDHPFRMSITRWDTSPDADGHLVGTFAITNIFTNAFGTQVHLEEYETVSVVRNST